MPTSQWFVLKVSAISATTAWVAASNLFTGGGAIYKTTDGGLTWTKLEVFSDASFVTVVHFWDENNGVAIGDEVAGSFEIYTTSDGGDSWTAVDSENIPSPMPGGEFVSTSVCSVVGDHIWFGTRFSRVFHSPDRGLSWTVGETPISSITSNPWVEGIAFTDELNGIAHSADYSSAPYQHLIALTNDGGLTWTEQVVEDNDFSLYKTQYIPGTNLLIGTSRASNGAGPYKTSYSYDNGISWTDIETGTPLSDFDFTDAGTAWGGKFKNNDDPTLMYKYTGEELTSLFTPEPLDAKLSISPNPAISFTQLTIQSEESTKLSLEIYNINGQLMASDQLGEGTRFDEKINLDHYPKGIYTFVVRNAEGAMLSEQVVKQ